MRKSEWYVIQVQTGHEQQMCQVIEGLCSEASLVADEDGFQLLDECFSPRFRTQHKRKGRWVDVEHALLPGYVVAVTAHPDALAQVLHKAPEFSRMLRLGETYVPLHEEERRWLEEQTKVGERVVPMSFGYKCGDTLVVTEGPLKGREAMVTRVNRSKSLASLEFHVGQLTIRTTVGLGIVQSKEDN